MRPFPLLLLLISFRCVFSSVSFNTGLDLPATLSGSTTLSDASDIWLMKKFGSDDLTMIASSYEKKKVFYAHPQPSDKTKIEENTNLIVGLANSDFKKVRSVAVGALTQGGMENGFPDIVVADENDLDVLKNPQNSDAGFNSPVEIGSCSHGLSVQVVDLDSDGCNDIVVACKEDWEPKFFRSKCMDTLTSNDFTEISLGHPTFGSWENFEKIQEIEIADLNGDGSNDIVIGNDGGDMGVGVFLFTYSGDTVTQVKKWALMDGGDGSSIRSSFSQPDKVQSVAICDVDGDGDLDIISLFKHDGLIVYHESRLVDGTSSGWTTSSSNRLFKQPVLLTQASAGMSDGKEIRCKDLDGDGYPELSLADKNGGVKIIQNNGPDEANPFASDPVTISSISFTGAFANLIDLNRDGMLDVVFGVPTGDDGDRIRAIYNAALCPAGKYLNTDVSDLYTGGVCTSCESGQYTSSPNKLGTCNDCSYPQVANGGRTGCESCAHGTYVSDDEPNRTCQPCEAGTYSDGAQSAGTCANCAAGTISSAGAASCSPCNPNTFSNVGDESCQSCGTGKFYEMVDSVNQCTNCPTGKFQNAVRQTGTVSNCENCAVNTFTADLGSSECAVCPSGTSSAAGASGCSQCQPGNEMVWIEADSVFRCQACTAGKYSDEIASMDCKSCADDTTSTEGSSSCTPCTSGMVSYSGNTQCYTACGSGQYLSPTFLICVSCEAGKYSDDTGRTCTPCEEGKYLNTEGQNSCLNCPKNTEQGDTGGTSCPSCSDGMFSNPGSEACTVCVSGEYHFVDPSSDIQSCPKCPKGTYQDSYGMISACSNCPPGTYQDEEGGLDCEKQCQPGTSQPYEAAVSIDDCQKCAEGKFASGLGSAYCSDCDAGKYQPSEGGNVCAPCEEGKSSGEGSSSCSGIFISSVVPSTGGTRGGEWILIKGSKLEETHVKIGPAGGDEAICSEVSGNATQITCKTPPGTGKHLDIKIIKNDGSGKLVQKRAFSYDSPHIASVTGCQTLAYAETLVVDGSTSVMLYKSVNCPTTGRTGPASVAASQVVLTISGSDFGFSVDDIDVTIDDRICSNLTLAKEHDKLECDLPFGTGEDVGVTVTVNEQVGVSYLLSYAPPVVHTVAGCNNVGGTTTDCPRVSGVTLNITGEFFGPNQPIIMIGGEICTAVEDIVYNGDDQNEVHCTLPPGSGSLKGINAIQINGLISEGVSLLSYKKCSPGEKNVLNSTLGYFECLLCEAGHYSTIEESFTCTQCLQGSYLESSTTCTMCSTKVPNSLSTSNGAEGLSSCVCPRKTFFDADMGLNGTCVSCDILRGVSCNLPGQRLETLQLRPGFWRSSPTSTSIKRCYNSEACKGTLNASASENSISDSEFNSTEAGLIDYCAAGYEGPYCDVCSQGYSGSFGSCRKCKGGGGGTSSIVWTVILLILAVLGFLFMGWTVQKFSKKSKKALLIGGKLFISTVQILMAIPEVFEVVLPKNFLEFLSYFNIFNFGFIEIFDIGCSVEVNVHHLMLSATLIPFFMTFPILGMWLYHYISESDESSFRSRQALKMNTVSLLLSMSYFFLPGTSMSIFAIYPCDSLDDGTSWLKNDYSINCGEGDEVSSHDAYRFYGFLMLCMYPIGIPLLYTFVLTKDRAILNPKEQKGLHPLNRRGQVYNDWEEKVITEREQNDSIQHTVFLWGSYRPKAWWFEIFECLRRLALTGALVFIRQGSQTQIALGCMICIISGMIFALVWPYATFRDNVLGILSHCQLIGTLFSAMMYKLGKNAELAYDQEASGWMLIGLNGTVFAIMLGWVGFEVFVDEGPSLRSRERQFLAQASFLLSGGSVRGRFMATGQSVTESNIEMTGDFGTSADTGGRNMNTSGISSGASSLSPGLNEIYNRDSVGSGILEEDNPMFKKGAMFAKDGGGSVNGGGGGGPGRGLTRNSSTKSATSSKRSLFGRVKMAKSTAGQVDRSSSNLSEGEGGGENSGRESSSKRNFSSRNGSRNGSTVSDGGGSVGSIIEEGLGTTKEEEVVEDEQVWDDLPEGWSKAYDEASSAWYYWNISSGETVWEKPEE